MCKQIQTALMAIGLFCGVTAATAVAQTNGTNSSAKMSNRQLMDKMNHMTTSEKAAMFDKMTDSEKMEAMKMAGHDMSKMSHQERMDTLNRRTPEQKATLFDKMPMDTRMATMRMANQEHSANRTR